MIQQAVYDPPTVLLPLQRVFLPFIDLFQSPLSMFWLWLIAISAVVSSSAERHSDHVFDKDEIIELPVGRFPDPLCEYNVRQKGKSGPPVTGQVKVGDTVYHEWSCSYGEKDSELYCLLVHNCTVSGVKGSKNVVPILDEFGCSFFPNILPHVEYSEDLRGGLLVNAFSLDVDQAAVFFECNVKLLLKLNGVCRRPTCPSLEKLRAGSGSSSRSRRHISS